MNSLEQEIIDLRKRLRDGENIYIIPNNPPKSTYIHSLLLEYMRVYAIWWVYRHIAEDCPSDPPPEIIREIKAAEAFFGIMKIVPLKAKKVAYFIYAAQEMGKLKPFQWKREKQDLKRIAEFFEFSVSNTGASSLDKYYFEAKRNWPNYYLFDELLPITKKLP